MTAEKGTTGGIINIKSGESLVSSSGSISISSSNGGSGGKSGSISLSGETSSSTSGDVRLTTGPASKVVVEKSRFKTVFQILVRRRNCVDRGYNQ